MKRNMVAAISLIGIGITIGAWLVFNFSSDNGLNLFAKEKIGAESPPLELKEDVTNLNNAFMNTSIAILPNVVSINVIVEQENPHNPFREQWKEFFKFFGDVPFDDSPRRMRGAGSGVHISSNGYIVTNNHVVEDATEIEVTTYDKKKHKAELIGTDPLTDLAIIKIEGDDYPVAHFADINDVKIGEWVIAAGNPLGLNSTITAGIISAIGRGGLGLPNRRNGYSVENFIQTDAAINPGNSGGGLFNLQGSLVGINTAIATRTGTYIGYGFAIPVDLVKSVTLDLIEDGKINRGYIGVRIRTIDETEAKAVGLNKVEGVMVHDIIDGGAAEKAGIQQGDVILELDGKPVKTSNELQSLIVLHRAGDKIALTIWRNEQKIKKTVTLKARENDDELASNNETEDETTENESADELEFEKLGFKVSKISKEIGERLDIKRGALIIDVKRFSEAYDRGLTPGGVITKADGKTINSLADLKDVIDSKSSGDGILIYVKYKDTNRIVALAIP